MLNQFSASYITVVSSGATPLNTTSIESKLCKTAARIVSNTRKYDHISPTTRNSQMLHIPLYKTTTGQRTVYFRTLKLWNSLDPAHKLKPTLKDFKSCLKKNLCQNFGRRTKTFTLYCSTFLLNYQCAQFLPLSVINFMLFIGSACMY